MRRHQAGPASLSRTVGLVFAVVAVIAGCQGTSGYAIAGAQIDAPEPSGSGRDAVIAAAERDFREARLDLANAVVTARYVRGLTGITGGPLALSDNWPDPFDAWVVVAEGPAQSGHRPVEALEVVDAADGRVVITHVNQGVLD